MSYFWNLLTSQDNFAFPSLLALAAAKATLLLAFAFLLCSIFRRLPAATRHLLWASALCASLMLPFLSSVKVWEVSILPAQMAMLSSRGANEPNVKDDEHVMQEARATTRGISRAPDAGAGLQKKSEIQTNASPLFQTNASPLESPAPPPNTSVSQATPYIPTTPLPSRLVNWALALWVIGAWLFLFKLLTGFVAVTLLTRRAAEFADPSLNELFSSLLREVGLKRGVRLLRSERTSMPIVYGIFRPAVLLPAEAEGWTEERLRMVLLHELTHITRRDCLTQMLAQVACVFYWFNPLVWYAVHRLRVEREQACDDYVLSIGTKPSDYANHLLEIARSMQERSMFEWSQTATVAMARRSQLEGRLLSILSKENKRGAMSRALTWGLLTLICVLLLALVAVHPTPIHAQSQEASPHEANSEKGSGRRLLPDSFAVAGALRADELAAPGVSAHETATRQDGTAALVDSVQGKTVNGEEFEKGTKSNVQDTVERIVEQESIEAAAEQITTVVQMPEVKLSTGEEANLFIKAGHKQEQTRPAQNRSGDYIDEMAAVGYTNLSVDELIRLKTAGVNADYVRSLRALGFTNLTSKELASLSIHGVTTVYIQAIRAAGYNNLSAKELTTFRIHDITAEYIRTLREAGYGNLTAKQLTEFAVHGVTPAFIGAIRAAGYGNLSPKELVSLRVYGVTPAFIRRARERLGELTVKQITSLKEMGILEDEKGKEKDKEKN